ncbi:MAG TPA: hypothetical protein VK742_15430 [Candidatus Sulfotelmatobacter sp.]|jgi:hypothetical protein|nr:hypothetical protein [Candidatus Sulfotelmatobacter sp.]
MNQPARTRRRPKPELSAHQKQMRFFTCLAMAVGFILFAAIFWFINRTSLVTVSAH